MTQAKLRRLACLFAGILVIAGAIAGPIRAQDPLPEDRGAVGLWQAIRRLQTTATVLHITAHPDDEDAALLTTLARGHGLRTISLSLTRGEGGANLISSDFFDALGVLRTLEHLEADRRYGVEQYYTRAVDYGYSKTLEEALKSWGGEERVLEDVVRVIRMERPDIIVARFRGDPRDGHGHHMFSGVIAQRARDAAGDPKRFPEQIREGLRPWLAAKIFVPHSRSEPEIGRAKIIPTGVYDPILGQSYAQLARVGYSLHRSQGIAGGPVWGGPQDSRYRMLAGNVLIEGADHSDRLDMAIRAGSQMGNGILNGAFQAELKFDAKEPEKCLEPLIQGLRAARDSIAAIGTPAPPPDASAGGDSTGTTPEHQLFLLRQKELQFQKAIVLALGLEVSAVTDTGRRAPWMRDAGPDAVAPFQDATPGETFPVRVRLLNRSSLIVNPASFVTEAPPGWSVTQEKTALEPLGYNQISEARFQVTVAADAKPTRPHWHRDSIQETFYTCDSPELATLPLPPPPMWARVRFEVLQTPVEVRIPVQNLVEDPVLGNRSLPLSVVPAISVAIRGENGIVRPGQREYKVSVALRSSGKGPLKGALRLEIPGGWRSTPEAVDFALQKEGEESTHDFVLALPGDLPDITFTIEAVARVGDREYREGWRTITARDIGRAHFFRPARLTVRGVNAGVAGGLRIGYVMGSGDEVPQGLEQLGARVALLSSADISSGDLGPFSSIWIGVRAYAVRPELKTHHRRLMEYVERGGVLIVQYQTPEYEGDFAPFPYRMTQSPEEVSEQDSPVAILAAENPLLSTPNKITLEDFEGWVEQRGSKFWKTWDDRYTPLLETHDAAQDPQKGGWLFARSGKGAFVYCAYAWYRQLPNAVPGAYRIVANLLSLRDTLDKERR